MGFNPSTYRLQNNYELYELLDQAVDGGKNIFVHTDDDRAANALALQLARFRKAHEIQNEEDWEFSMRYSALKFIPKLTSKGCEDPGVMIGQEVKKFKVTVMED